VTTFETVQIADEETYKVALNNWLDLWNRDGYQLATDSWPSSNHTQTDIHNRSDEQNTSHSSDDSLTNNQHDQTMIDLWREHYLLTYDRSLRQYCSDCQLNYDCFVSYITNTYGDNDGDELRAKTVHRSDVRRTNSIMSEIDSCFLLFLVE
jgi:hypothetical protein